MLQTIRDRATGIVAWVIVILLIVPFALWGIYDYFQGGAEVYVARVNDTKISPNELDRAYQQQRRRLQAMLGPNFNPALFDAERMRREVLDSLIQRELLTQAAVSAGFRISDAQLAAAIRTAPEFQEEGSFSRRLYEQQTGSIGLTPAGFEVRQRESMLIEQLYRGIAGTAIITPREVDQVIRLEGQERELSYLMLPVSDFMEGVEIDDESVAEYYEAHRDRYMTPERVQVAYLDLNAQDLARGVEVSEEELRGRYESQQEIYIQEEQRQASHILIQVAQDASDEEVAAAQAKAEELYERIQQGEDFAALAREYSEDPGSAEAGGDLGFFGKGVMDPAFEEAVFSLEKGEVSKPVRSSFGFHIIKLTDIRPQRKKTFEEVRQQLVADLRQRRAEREFYELAENLQNLAYEHPDSLVPAAEAAGLEVQETDWITREGGEGIASDPRIVNAAFSEEVLNEGYNSEPIELASDRLVVLRVREHQPAAQQPLEEVKDEIRETLRRQAAQEQSQSAGEDMVARLEAGADLTALAQEHGVEVQRPGFVGRNADAVDAAIRSAAFTLPRPAEGESSETGLALASGDYAVLAVSAVRDGDPTAAKAEEKEQTRAKLLRDAARRSFDGFVAELRHRADIVINEDQI